MNAAGGPASVSRSAYGTRGRRPVRASSSACQGALGVGADTLRRVQDHNATSTRTGALGAVVALTILYTLGIVAVPIVSNDFDSAGDAWLITALILAPVVLLVGVLMLTFRRTRSTGKGAVLIAGPATALLVLVALFGLSSLR